MDREEFYKLIDNAEERERAYLFNYLIGYFSHDESFRELVIQKLEELRNITL